MPLRSRDRTGPEPFLTGEEVGVRAPGRRVAVPRLGWAQRTIAPHRERERESQLCGAPFVRNGNEQMTRMRDSDQHSDSRVPSRSKDPVDREGVSAFASCSDLDGTEPEAGQRETYAEEPGSRSGLAHLQVLAPLFACHLEALQEFHHPIQPTNIRQYLRVYFSEGTLSIFEPVSQARGGVRGVREGLRVRDLGSSGRECHLPHEIDEIPRFFVAHS